MAGERLSRGDLLLFIAVLAVFGIAVSGYLAWQWYASESASWCDLTSYFNCTKVRDSPWAAVAGVPTAFVGVAGFGILLALALIALRGVERIGRWSVDGWLLAFAVPGGLMGLGLTFIEIFVIQAICILCVIGFALDLGVLGIAWALAGSARASAA